MRLIITGDIHNGAPSKLKDCIWSMDIINQYAIKNKIETVMVCGDLFHDRVSLGIDVINAVYDQFKKCKESGVKWMAFCGNHDMYLKNSWECNSVHPFGELVEIYETITSIELGDVKFWIVPFIHYEADYMEAIKKIDEQASENDVLLTHIGVNGASLNECFLLKNWKAVSFEDTKFKVVFTGHFHCHQKVGEKVWYPGSPIPFRFDDGLVDHGFIVYDTDTNEIEFVKLFDICSEFSDYRPPDYLTIPDDDIVSQLEQVQGNHIRVFLSKEYTINELATIRNILQNKKGALSVNWMKPKVEVDEVSALQNQLAGVETPERTFDSWLELDKPQLNVDLLKLLFNKVKTVAEERIVVEEEPEDA